MNRIDFNIFKLRALCYVIFIGTFLVQAKYTESLLTLFLWMQIEYILHMLNLEDSYISAWEEKLKSMIKDSDAKTQ